MKKIILVLAFSAFGYLSLQAQEFQGMAVYESKPAQLILNRISGNRVTPEMQNQLKSV
jgi:hypothetical protein